jgi:hypothetical protein
MSKSATFSNATRLLVIAAAPHRRCCERNKTVSACDDDEHRFRRGLCDDRGEHTLDRVTHVITVIHAQKHYKNIKRIPKKT